MDVMEKTAKLIVIVPTLGIATLTIVLVLMDGLEKVVKKVSQIIISISVIYLNT